MTIEKGKPAFAIINPETISAPIGSYSNGIIASGPGQWLFTSGQTGVNLDGSVPQSIEEQGEIIWFSIMEILRAAGMDATNLIKVTTYVTDLSHLPSLKAIRLKYLGDVRPASVLVVVKALARPEWLVEIDATAFKCQADAD